MKITLEEAELHAAIITHIMSMGFNVNNKELTIDFTAGRGANGSSATIEVTSIADVKIEDSVEEASSNATGEQATDPSSAESSPITGDEPVFDEKDTDPFN